MRIKVARSTCTRRKRGCQEWNVSEKRSKGPRWEWGRGDQVNQSVQVAKPLSFEWSKVIGRGAIHSSYWRGLGGVWCDSLAIELFTWRTLEQTFFEPKDITKEEIFFLIRWRLLSQSNIATSWSLVLDHHEWQAWQVQNQIAFRYVWDLVCINGVSFWSKRRFLY